MQIETFDMIWGLMRREFKGTGVQKVFHTPVSDACPWILRYPQYEFYSPLLVAMSQRSMNGCHPQLWNRRGLTSSTGSSPQTLYIRSQISEIHFVIPITITQSLQNGLILGLGSSIMFKTNGKELDRDTANIHHISYPFVAYWLIMIYIYTVLYNLI